MPSSWTGRTEVSSIWDLTRLGGAYLTDVSGNYITTMAGERIVVIVPGGTLSLSTWTTRPSI